MKWFFALILLLGLITVVSIVSFKRGESIIKSSKVSEAGLDLSSSGIKQAGTFETATFALG